MTVPGTTITDVGTGAAQAIGRYFSVISVVPSSLYVTFIYILIASGSWTTAPNWPHALTQLEHPGISGVAFLAFLSIALGIILHPIQFALVQFLEGYWGASSPALAVRTQRILHYQRAFEKLESKQKIAHSTLADLDAANTVLPARATARLDSELSEAERVLTTNFPSRLGYVMPTRLGNMLRRAESQAGSQYGIDALQSVPHLLMIAPEEQVSYVNDQRTLLDLAVRMTFLSAMATATALLFLWPYGKTALVALFPYSIAYVSYRGSIVAARHYGFAINLLINLNRFRLYEELHLPLPPSTTEERNINEALQALFAYDPDESVEYQHPAGNGLDGPAGSGTTPGS